MPLTVLGLNYTQISSCDSGNAGGTWDGSPSIDMDNYKQGSASISDALKNTGNNDWTFTPTVPVNLSGVKHLRIWMLLTQGSLINTESNGGIQIGLSDGMTTGYYYVGGRDTYFGGWKNFVVDVSRPVDFGTKPSMTAVTSITIRINLIATAKNVDNTWIDNLCICDGLIIYGDEVGAYFNFDDVFRQDDTPAIGGWGIITKYGGIYYAVGELRFGDATGSNICKFNAKNQILIFEDRSTANYENINSTLMGINIVDNGIGTTEFILGEKSGTNGISGCVIGVQDTEQGSKYYLDGATDTDVDNFKLYGTSIYESNDIKLPATASNVEILNCNFIGCGPIDANTAKIKYCNFISSDSNAVKISSTSFQVTYCNFIDCAYGIQITTASTYSFDALNFYNNTTDINNTSGGSVTINVDMSTTTNPPTTYTGSTTINNTVYLRVYAKDEENTNVQNAQVAIFKSSDDTQLMNEDTDVNGLAEETFNYTADTDIYVRVRKSSSGSTRYYPVETTGAILSTGFTLTVVLKEDSLATS